MFKQVKHTWAVALNVKKSKRGKYKKNEREIDIIHNITKISS